MLPTEKVRETVDQILTTQLGESFEHAEIRIGEDHSGDKALFIKAFFKPRALFPSGRVSNHAATQLRFRLLDQGDERFPYLNMGYPPESPRVRLDE